MKTTKAPLSLLWKLAFGISPGYVLMLFLRAATSGGQILANVILPKLLIDGLMEGADPWTIALYAGAIVLSNGLFTLCHNAMEKYLSEKDIYMSEMLQLRMAEKIMDAPYESLESPHVLDLKERAVFAISNQSALLNLVQTFAHLLRDGLTLAGLIALIATFSPLLVGVLLLLVATGILLYGLVMQKNLRFMQEQIIPVNRRYGYYVGLAFSPEIQKDIRLYNMGGMLTDRVAFYNRRINEELSAVYKMQGRFMGFYGILNDLQAAIAFAYAGVRAFTDLWGPTIGLGSLMMVGNAAIQFTRLSTALGENVLTLLQTLKFLLPFREFMALKDEADMGGHEPFIGQVESIRFDGVSFRYPGSEENVLENISFEIKAGERIAIVGLNGAGKTTLIKLLCRLYKPDSGTITVNGKELFAYDHETYMAQIAAVFQDYKLFAYTVEENVSGKAPTGDERAREMLQKVGLTAKLSGLEQGMQTLLGKAYNQEGTEFSGGEQQKVAIARALYKDASLVILDEPTSALDPLAEAEIYENFNGLIGDKTAIYISHRMSSSVFCDRILLLEGGRVKDYDTHEALMAKKDGLYYKLFMSQADHYKVEG